MKFSWHPLELYILLMKSFGHSLTDMHERLRLLHLLFHFLFNVMQLYIVENKSYVKGINRFNAGNLRQPLLQTYH